MSTTLTKEQRKKLFQKNFEKYSGIHEKNHELVSIQKIENVGQENNAFGFEGLKFDLIYARQDQLALKYLMNLSDRILDTTGKSLQRFLDVGSRISSAALFATVARCFYLEPRIGHHHPGIVDDVYADLNMTMIRGEAQQIPFDDETFCAVTSLHAIEHFGLGRYGDTIDPLGDINGLREFYRVLAPDGWGIFSVPVTYGDRERIVFDDERLYSIETFDKVLRDIGFIVTDVRCLLTCGQMTGPVPEAECGGKSARYTAVPESTPGAMTAVMERIRPVDDDLSAQFAYFVVAQKPIKKERND